MTAPAWGKDLVTSWIHVFFIQNTDHPRYKSGIRFIALQSYSKQSLYQNQRKQNLSKTSSAVVIDKEWMDGRIVFFNYRIWTTSPSATSVTTKRHLLFNIIQVYFYILMLSEQVGSSSYQWISNCLERH